MLYVMSMCVCIGSYAVCVFVLQYGRTAVAECCNYKSNQIKSYLIVNA